ncbi:MAG: hypothetical protein ACRCX2_07600, partial [Paraclostridium sp.]
MKYPGGPEYNPKPHKAIRSEAMMGLGHVAGNIVARAREVFIGKFPKGLFKTIHTDTRAAFTELSNIDKTTDDHLLTNSKPLLNISPKFDYQYVSEFYSSYFHDNISPFDHSTADAFTGCPFADHDKGTALYNTYTRIQMKMEFTMVFETEAETRNVYNYIIRHIPSNKFLPYMVTTLENQVPKEFLRQIAIDAGFITDPENNPLMPPEMVPLFVRYLNAHSPSDDMRFVNKYKNGTATQEIFHTYETDAMVYFDDMPSVSEGEKKGMTTTNYEITMTMVIMCTIPSVYYFSSEHSHYNSIENMITTVPDNTIRIPVLTFKYDFLPCHFNIGQDIYSEYLNTGYAMDEDVEEESIPLFELFDARLKRIKDFYDKANMPYDFFATLVFENGEIKTDGSLDFTTGVLTLKNMKKEHSYMIGLYINKELLTTLENKNFNK